MPDWIKRKRVWIPGAALLALGLYAAVGFWWAPSLVRNAIVERGSEALGVPVSVGEVITHPFTLEMTVREAGEVAAAYQRSLQAVHRRGGRGEPLKPPADPEPSFASDPAFDPAPARPESG